MRARFEPEGEGATARLVRRSGEPVFVHVDRPGSEPYYGELLLCFAATYRPAARHADQRLCFVRWLDKVAVVAAVEGRALTPEEAYGPFESFRWATKAGSFRNGHPPAGAPHYGIVVMETVHFRAPIFSGPAERVGIANPLYRLVDNMQRSF